MYPPTHLITGLTIGLAGVKLGYFNTQEALTLSAITTLIDTDHYLYYCWKHKTLNFKKAWDAAVLDHEAGERTAIHHFWGFCLFTIFLIFLYYPYPTWAIILGLAYYSHMLLDYVPIPKKKKINFSLFNLAFKISYWELALNIILILSIIIF